MVYQCTGCDTFTLQPLGILKASDDNKQVKFKLPVGPPVGSACEHCGNSFHVSLIILQVIFLHVSILVRRSNLVCSHS